MQNQRFDFNEATSLKNKLTTDVSKVEAELQNMMNSVQGVKNWWSGGSEDAFIENFGRTKTKIVSSLNQCIEEYKVLIQQISEAKQESDAAIARQLNK